MSMLALFTRRGFKVSSSSQKILCDSRTKFRSIQSVLEKRSLSSKCDLNIVSSPYPDIEIPGNIPVAEFMTSDWGKHQPNGFDLNKTAIIDGSTGVSRSFENINREVGNMAETLKNELNVTDQSTIVLFSPNHVDYLSISLSVSICGAKLSPANPQYKQNELRVILERANCDVLIFHSSLKDTALEASKGVESIRHIVMIPDDDSAVIPTGCLSLNALKDHNRKGIFKTDISSSRNLETHPFLLPYSSGTTGLPKGVCLSHTNIIANLLQCNAVEDVTTTPGSKLITMSGRFDLELFCQLVENHKPQRAHLVPPIILGLAKSPIVDKYDLSSLKMIVSAAAPLSKEVEDAVTNRIGCSVKQAWGMSELSPIGTLCSDYNFKSGSVGPTVSNTFARIVDPETGENKGSNTEGELLLKGPQVMMGYLNEPEKTADCLSSDGWLRTGDVAYYDDDGFFYISDRLKELIKVRGYPVAPAELEALLLTHPDILDAAVVPIPDEASGELPRAYVVLKNQSQTVVESTTTTTVVAEDIQLWVKEQVAPFKQLKGGIVFIDQIPKSASGKILRRLLVDDAKKKNYKI